MVNFSKNLGGGGGRLLQSHQPPTGFYGRASFLRKGHLFGYYHGSKFSLVVLLDLLFSISDVFVKVVSDFKDIHYFSKIGEGKRHYLITNDLRKKYGDLGSFPFLRGQLVSENSNIIQSHQNGIGFLYQRVSPSPFLFQRSKQTLKEKLCTEHLSQSLPQIFKPVEFG